MTMLAITTLLASPTAATARHHPDDPPRACRDAREAIAWYRARYNQHRAVVGANSAPALERHMGCRRARQRARYWISAARANRAAAARWVETQYHWWKWLPDKFSRVGACETGYGKRPGSWTWDSGTYVSAFGIYRPAYAQFARQLGLPTWDDPGLRTPREQYQVAAAIQARYGWSAWGCGSA